MKPRIVITVSGGVAEIADSQNWPEGLEIFLVDYDNGEDDPHATRVDGDACSLRKLEKADADKWHNGFLTSATVKAWEIA